MLEVLKIRNIAIINSAEIQFKSGLNIISGETGAGKSIIIEAISLLLGSRASSELIRSGCDEAIIEGLFSISDVPWMSQRLQQSGFDHSSNELLIKRIVHRAGRHRIFVNGELATLSILQNLCEGLIDLCSQHEHQTLLKPSRQLELLDRYGGLCEQAKTCAKIWNSVRKLTQEKVTLGNLESERSKRADFLKFQISEIEEAGLEPNEDAELLKQKQLLQSAESRAQAAQSAYHLLQTEDESVSQILRAALQKIRSLQALDENTAFMVESLERAVVEIEELSLNLDRYLRSVELEPEKLQGIQDRLSLLADMKRKYGNQITDILDALSQLKKEFADFDQATHRLCEIQQELEGAIASLRKVCKKLSSARKKISELLATSVTSELKDLKMEDAKFLIELITSEDLNDWNSSGADRIQFLVQTNRGEPARPIGKIASGGELSRLMLAVRRVISDRGGIGVYLFDEIDAGIGGQIAFQVGKKLKSVSSYNQVICITHLPQVAAFADNHLVVRKSVTGKRTTTEVASLSKVERKEELARMLAGPSLTKKSIENASELLEMASLG